MPTQAEKEARISSGVKRGETLQVLADELGVSRQRIHQIMQRLGLHSIRGKTTYLGDDGLNQGERILKERETRKADLTKRKAQAVELVRNGMSYEKSAKRVGLSVPTVSKACAAAQVNSLQSNETIDRQEKGSHQAPTPGSEADAYRRASRSDAEHCLSASARTCRGIYQERGLNLEYSR